LALIEATIRALACDFDGTLASNGVVAEATTAALARFRASGRRLLLVTGRELEPLRQIYPYLGFFDACICENGATLYQPDRETETPLAPGPTPDLLSALAGIEPLSIGRVIIASDVANETRLGEAIKRARARWRTIRNKDSVMALPEGIDKGSGLKVALGELGLDAQGVVGVGDAENDEPLLGACGIGAAVANALPALKAAAGIVTRGACGDGVTELIERILAARPEGRQDAGPAERTSA
jgi:hydroxymethylpyrimidine pyrophosphatase-like HAD family hydrolase